MSVRNKHKHLFIGHFELTKHIDFEQRGTGNPWHYRHVMATVQALTNSLKLYKGMPVNHKAMSMVTAAA